MGRIARTAYRAILTTVFLVVAGYGFVTLIAQDCETELCCEECEALTVVRIIDGDTFVSDRGRVRLYGMDAPEIGRACSRKATQRLRRLAGETVRVEGGPRSSDPFGRLLYYVYTRSGASIDETLVREGLARAWTRDGQHREFLTGVETEVRQHGTGCLW